MANPSVIKFTDDTFKSQVLESDLPVLVDFWAVWCGPCKAIAPVVEKLAQDYGSKLKVGKVDIDNNQRVAEQFGIRSIPTLLLFKGGKVVETIVGALPAAKIQAKLSPHLQG